MEARKVNLAAGHRRLGARSSARLLEEQTEALCRIEAADRMLIDLVAWAKAQHGELRIAGAYVRAANERASHAEYVAPEITEVVA